MNDIFLENITWNPTGWRNTYVNPKTGLRYAKQNQLIVNKDIKIR